MVGVRYFKQKMALPLLPKFEKVSKNAYHRLWPHCALCVVVPARHSGVRALVRTTHWAALLWFQIIWPLPNCATTQFLS